MNEKRYNLTMTNGTDSVYTCTWAEDLTAAQERVRLEFAAAPEVWDGWTAEFETEPKSSR